MCPSLIEIGSKTAEKNSAQTDRQTDRHYENNGHLAVNQKYDGRTWLIFNDLIYPCLMCIMRRVRNVNCSIRSFIFLY